MHFAILFSHRSSMEDPFLSVFGHVSLDVSLLGQYCPKTALVRRISRQMDGLDPSIRD